MVISTFSRHGKAIAWFFLLLFYSELLSVNRAFAGTAEAALYNIRRNYGHPDSRQVVLQKHKSDLPGIGIPDIRVNTKPRTVVTNVDQQTNIGGPTQPEMQAFQSVNAN